MTAPSGGPPEEGEHLGERVTELVTITVDGGDDDRLRAAHELASIAEMHPAVVSEAVPELRTALSDEEESIREATALVLATVGESTPDAVLPAAGDLARLLNGNDPATNNALRALMPVLQSEPEATLVALEDHRGELRNLANNDVPVVRQRATRLLLAFAGFRPTSLAEHETICVLFDVLERSAPDHRESIPGPSDGVDRRFNEFVGLQERRERQRNGTTREMAALALAELAGEQPSSFEGEVHRLIPFVDDEDPTVRIGAIDTVGRVAAVEPETTEQMIQPLVELLTDSARWPEVRVKVATALGLLAEVHPDTVVDAVEPRASDVRELLWAEEDSVRGGAVGLLAYLAEEKPQLAKPARDRLVELLNDEAPFVRGNAALTLGFSGETNLAEPLASLRETDPDESVRRAADRALDELMR